MRLRALWYVCGFMAACAPELPESRNTENPKEVDKLKQQAGGGSINRNFAPLPMGSLDGSKSEIALIGSMAETSFALMKPNGESFIYDYKSSTFESIKAQGSLKGATQTLTLPDGEAWFITTKGVARSVPKDGQAGAQNLALNLRFPQGGPKVLGAGLNWLALSWEEAGYIVHNDNKTLKATKIPLSDTLFPNGPKFGGKTADDSWCWFSDGVKLALLVPGATSEASALTEVNMTLQNIGSGPRLMGFAPKIDPDKGLVDFNVPFLVLSDSGLFLSIEGEIVPKPEPSPAESGSTKLTFATDIAPLNKKYCLGCHGPGSATGDYSTEETWKSDAANIVRTVQKSAKGKAGVMPTVSFGSQPTDEERDLMVRFLTP